MNAIDLEAVSGQAIDQFYYGITDVWRWLPRLFGQRDAIPGKAMTRLDNRIHMQHSQCVNAFHADCLVSFDVHTVSGHGS